MKWFGLKMNFLWILQVLALIFVLKIHFPINYSLISNTLDWASISREGRVTGAKFTRLRLQSNEDGRLIPENPMVSLERITPRRGMVRYRPLDPEPKARIRSYINWNGTRPERMDQRSTVQLHQPRDLIIAIGSESNGPDPTEREGVSLLIASTHSWSNDPVLFHTRSNLMCPPTDQRGI